MFPAVFAIFIHFSGDRTCIKDSVFIDPCCGSGGMFVQSAALVQSKQGGINRINVYGQEKEDATYRLAKMNLALRGISHNLGETNDSSFTHDLHKGLYFDYIMEIILTPVLMSVLSSENLLFLKCVTKTVMPTVLVPNGFQSATIMLAYL